jgi:fatty acid desaturase
VVAFVPRRRTVVEVAALAAAVMIAFEIGLTHWFYLYIVWFFPLVIVALALSHPPESTAEDGSRLASAVVGSSGAAPAPAV